jgi:phytoene dehydrogenase-like protein
MLAGSLEPYGWAICKGGSNQLAQAMVNFLEEHGGEVRLNAPVRHIDTAEGVARTVELDDGSRIPIDGVLLSNLDPRHTFLELVGESDLPSEFVPAVKRWRTT